MPPSNAESRGKPAHLSTFLSDRHGRAETGRSRPALASRALLARRSPRRGLFRSPPAPRRRQERLAFRCNLPAIQPVGLGVGAFPNPTVLFQGLDSCRAHALVAAALLVVHGVMIRVISDLPETITLRELLQNLSLRGAELRSPRDFGGSRFRLSLGSH
jgi:hypothetical protein